MELNSNNSFNELINLGKLVEPYVVGMEGNISKKTKNGFIIKCSGSKLPNLTFNDFVEFDINLNQLSNFEKRGSMELGFHSFFLNFENVNYVCHTHPTNTLKILCGNLGKKFSKIRLFPDQVIFNDEKSCLVDYRTPGKELLNEIKKQVTKFIKKEKKLPKLILLKNHGIITLGKTIDECYITTQICEKSAEIFLTYFDAKNVKKLTKKEIKKLLNNKNEKYRKSLL